MTRVPISPNMLVETIWMASSSLILLLLSQELNPSYILNHMNIAPLSHTLIQTTKSLLLSYLLAAIGVEVKVLPLKHLLVGLLEVAPQFLPRSEAAALRVHDNRVVALLTLPWKHLHANLSRRLFSSECFTFLVQPLGRVGSSKSGTR